MKIYYKYALVFIWMVVIFLFSNEGSELSSGRSSAIVSFFMDAWSLALPEDMLTFITRKSAHIVAYFILGMLLYTLVKDYKLSSRRAIWFSIGIALLYAITDELHQSFIPGRSAEIRDVVIDTVASGLGVGAFYILYRRRYTRKNSNNDV